MCHNISLKSIKELKDINFYIPSYQRGYRWKSKQVHQLIDDIEMFTPTENNTKPKIEDYEPEDNRNK